MITLTGLILTYNEEENIERTLSALVWVPRVILLDGFSTDRTLIKARAFPNVEVVQRGFDSHTAQWNFGLDQVATEWVLTLDADYHVSPELADEIQTRVPEAGPVGYYAQFEYRIFG